MTDYFLPRRLIQLMEEHLLPKGYLFNRWSVRGEELLGSEVYEFIFVVPGGQQEIASSISKFELERGRPKLNVTAGVLARRIVKKMEEFNNPPPSPA